MKTAQMKERIRAKAIAVAQAKATAKAQNQSSSINEKTVSEEELLKIFSTGEKVEKTPRGTKPPSNKKKKGKK